MRDFLVLIACMVVVAAIVIFARGTTFVPAGPIPEPAAQRAADTASRISGRRVTESSVQRFARRYIHTNQDNQWVERPMTEAETQEATYRVAVIGIGVIICLLLILIAVAASRKPSDPNIRRCSTCTQKLGPADAFCPVCGTKAATPTAA